MALEYFMIAVCISGVFLARSGLIWFLMIFVTHFAFKYW